MADRNIVKDNAKKNARSCKQPRACLIITSIEIMKLEQLLLLQRVFLNIL